MRVARWTGKTVEVRAIGALAALAPTLAIAALFVVSGSITALIPALLLVWLIAGLAGAIAAPATLRPRRRPLRGSLAFALGVLVLWGAFGVVDIVLGLAAGADPLESLGSLVMRVILIAAYGAFMLVPLWILGATWVVMTWFLDGLLGGERSGGPAA